MFESLQERPLLLREKVGALVAGWKYIGSMPAHQFLEMERLWLESKGRKQSPDSKLP